MPARVAPGDESGARGLLLTRCPRVRLSISYRRCGPFTPLWYEVSWYSDGHLQELLLQEGIFDHVTCLLHARRWWGGGLWS